MSARSKARKQALDILYESDIRDASAIDLLANREILAANEDVPSTREYTKSLLQGISDNLRKIDELIITYARGWDMDRLATVDRNILRLGIFEIIWVDDVDDSVAISEAIALAKDLSTEESSTFIHGVLGAIISAKPAIAR